MLIPNFYLSGSPAGSPIPGILQARTLEWVAISFSNAWKWKVKVKSLSQSCPTLSDPMDCSPSGSSIHRIFQARVLEWVAKQSIFLLVILHIFPIFHYDTALEEKFPFPLFSYFWKIFYCSPQGQEIEVHIL